MSTDLQNLDAILQHTQGIQQAVAAIIAGQQPPPPPPMTRVTTESELLRAIAAGGSIVVAPGDYLLNAVIAKPVQLSEEQPGTATLRPIDAFSPVLQVMSDDVTVTGFTILNGAPDRETVVVGSDMETDSAKQPTRVVFDGTTLKAGQIGGRRGFALHGREVTLRKCSVLNFWFKGRDSQAVLIGNGPGPYLIDGGTLEASGENIMLGGLSIPTGQNPTAIIRNATLRKPLAWKGLGYTIKNLFEIKAGVGVTLENCTLDGCWGGEGQSGSPIVLTPRNQNNDNPWVQVDQVTIRSNVVRNCPDGYAVNIQGDDDLAPSQPMRQVLIERNLFDHCRAGLLVQRAGQLALTMRRNTYPSITFHLLALAGPAMPSLTYVENVTLAGEYGVWGDDGQRSGLASLTAAVQPGGLTFTGNVIEQSAIRASNYPPGNRILQPGGLAALLDANKQMLDGSAGY